MPMIYVPFVVAAAEGAGSSDFDIVTVMQGAVNDVTGNLLKVLAIVVAGAVVVYGGSVAVRYGLKWLKALGRA